MRLRFCFGEEWKLSEVDMGMVGSVVMSLMRPTTIGVSVGCGGVCAKSVVGCGWSEEGDIGGLKKV